LRIPERQYYLQAGLYSVTTRPRPAAPNGRADVVPLLVHTL
jgi:hypothetical protein